MHETDNYIRLHTYSSCIVIAHPLPPLYPDVTVAGKGWFAVVFKSSRPKHHVTVLNDTQRGTLWQTRAPHHTQRGGATTPKTAQSNDTEKGTGGKVCEYPLLTTLLEARTPMAKAIYLGKIQRIKATYWAPLFSCSRKLLNLAQLWHPTDSSRLNLESAVCQAHPAAQRCNTASAKLKTRPLLLLRSQQESYLDQKWQRTQYVRILLRLGGLVSEPKYIYTHSIHTVLFCCKGFCLAFSHFLLQVEPSAAHQFQPIEGQNDLMVSSGDEMHHATGHLLANALRLLCCELPNSKIELQHLQSPVVQCEKLTKSWGIHRNRHEAIIRRDLS